jgi:hypothetical protein
LSVVGSHSLQFNTRNAAAMLDAFEIITTSGVVLWSKVYENVDSALINDFLRYAFIDERAASAASSTYRKDGKTIKWATAKDLGLIFVVCPGSDAGTMGHLDLINIGRVSVNSAHIMDR